MNDVQKGRIVGLGVAFRDLSSALLVVLPKCRSKDPVCPCKRCRILRAYAMFLDRYGEVVKET